MLSEQLAVDPQAGAVSAAPPPPAYASPTPAAASQETSGGIAVLKFIPIAVFLTMIGLSCLLCVMSSTCRSQV